MQSNLLTNTLLPDLQHLHSPTLALLAALSFPAYLHCLPCDLTLDPVACPSPGPIVAEAIFLNREELPVYPVYYDPVHDFAFVR